MTTSMPSPSHLQQSSSEYCLELENVGISYGGSEAVRGVYMKIPRGKITAFIGPSGCVHAHRHRCGAGHRQGCG